MVARLTVRALRIVTGRVRGVMLLLMLALTVAASATAQPSWSDLETRGAVITRIDVVVADVFERPADADLRWLARAANAMHVETRRAVVERELLFAVGDPVKASRIDESARNLRRHRFVREARIVPALVDETGVVARVEIFDAWSLNVDVSLDRTGGTNEWELRLDEANLFGRGKQIAIGRASDIARTSTEIAYTDPQVLGSRWVVAAATAELSDGHSRAARVTRPYYALETRGAVGLDARDASFVTTQYSGGRSVYTIGTRRTTATAFVSHAWRVQERTAWRAGLNVRTDRATFDAPLAASPSSLPVPLARSRGLRGVSVTASIVQDRPAVLQNLAAIGHTEDYNLGWVVAGEAGYFAPSLGSDQPGVFTQTSLRKGWRAFDRGLLLANMAAGGRRGSGLWQDATAAFQLTAYAPSGRGQTIAAQFDGSAVAGPEPGRWLYVGGSDGLRGYVDHFIVGDRRLSLAIEHRVVTPWRVLDLLQVGFVVYADAAMIRRLDTARWSRVYGGVGAGLRFGNLRVSGRNVVQLSVAVPMVREAGVDRVQLVLGNAVRF